MYAGVPALAVVGLVCTEPASAAEYSYTLAASEEFTDNARLAPRDEEDETAHVLSAGFQLTETRQELDARIQARAAYREYVHDIFADQATLGFAGNMVWKPRPNVFHWSVDDVYTQVLADSTVADTPANRVNVNVFSTGPDLFWRISNVQSLQLGGRVAVSSFDETDDTASGGNGDNKRRRGTVRWHYRATPLTAVSLGYLAEEVEFDDAAVARDFDFRRYETSLGLTSQVARNNLSAEVGYNRIRRQNQEEVDGALGRLSWRREITQQATFSLIASQSLSDTAQDLVAVTNASGLSADATSVSSTDIFVSRRVSAEYALRGKLNTLTLSLFREERVFEIDEASDEERKGGTIVYGRLFTPAVTGTVSVGYVDTLFPNSGREDESRTAGVGVNYKINRTLFADVNYTRRTRDSSDANADYVENRAVVSLGYSSLPTRW